MNRKKRVLVVNEFHALNTGYSNYGEALLKGLYETGKYELAELACYCTDDDPKRYSAPWRVFPNSPAKNSPEIEQYNSSNSNVFGEYRFEKTCLEFFPDVVIAFRDFWHDAFISNSPFRPFYSFLLMPACDAIPQAEEWLYTYSTTNACFSYSDWGAKVLQEAGGGKINCLGSASPVPLPAYRPLDKNRCKAALGIDPSNKIVGFVARNQKRKLFPDLFDGFRRYLDKSNRTDVYLHCHTSFPDAGWNIPEYLKKFGVSNRVLFTYMCKNAQCGHICSSFFSDAAQVCPKCHQLSMTMPDVKNGLNHEQMSVVYNCFDLYAQVVVCEGYGMPVPEAAACGVPLSVIDYSALQDFIAKLDAYPLKVKRTITEMETGCQRAVPDIDCIADTFYEFFDNLTEEERTAKGKLARQLFEEEYQLEKLVGKWSGAIDEYSAQLPWNASSRTFSPAVQIPQNLSNSDYVKFLLVNVLGEPWRLGSYIESRFVRDLTYGYALQSSPQGYFNEDTISHSRPMYMPFNRDSAYDFCVHMLRKKNYWENLRMNTLERMRG